MPTLEVYTGVNANNIGVAINGDYMYVANYGNSQITRVNLTDSTDKTLAWATSTQGVATPYCVAIDAQGGYLYCCNISTPSYISKISLSSPTTNFTANWVSFPTGYSSTAAIVIGNYIYVSYTNNLNGGGTINYINKYSLTDPVNDRVIGWATTTNCVDSFLVYNNILYVGVRSTGIYTISMSDPIGSNSLFRSIANKIYGLALDGTYLIASLQEIGRLARVNLCNPTEYNASYINDATNLNYVSGIAMFGNYLFAAMYSTSNIVRVMLRDTTTYKDFGAGNSSNRHVIEDGKYLYICNYTGNRISRQSLTDATDFTLNWATSTQGISSPGAMVLYNGYIYVFNKGSARTSIPKISITNPTTDFTTNWRSVNVDSGGNTFYADGACVYNNYLYISFGNQNSTLFKITRISMIDPTNDYTPDWYIPTYFCFSIIPYNGYFYAGVPYYGIRKISFADPVNDNTSVITSKVFTTNIISALEIQGDSLYFSLFNSNAIGKISISNPSASRSTIEFVKSNTNLSGAFGIAARGSVLYAVSYNTTTLVTIPISSENAIMYKDLSTFSLLMRYSGYIASDGNYMYIVNYVNSQIMRVDILNPNNITYSWATSTQGLVGTASLAIYNGYLYVVNRGSPSNQVISRISLSAPTTDYTTNWRTTTLGASYYTNSCVVVNNYLYISYNGTGYPISRINLTNPTGDYSPNWASTTNDVYAMTEYGGYLYVGIYNAGIHRISLTNPGAGAVLWVHINQTTSRTASITGFAIQNNYLYAASSNTTPILRFLLSDPTSATNIPEFAGTYDTLIFNGPKGIIINGNYIYGINNNTSTIFRVIIDPSISEPLPGVICFKKDSRILTSKGYRKIQHLKKGDLVKTLNHGFRPIFRIGKKEIYHHPTTERSKEHLYRCSKTNYPELFEDLVLTGCHSLLVDDYVDELQYRKTIEVNGATYVTEGKYRLPVCADLRASVYETAGKYLVYHIALENESYYGNYGIFANGLLVESTSKRFLEEDNIMETI
jgi:6-phosphogluconolactonase (cycloisomerase 2 family)